MPKKTQNWIVTTSGDRPTKEVAKDLKAAGFSVGQVLDEIGTITGEADDNAVEKVRAIRGVVDVSRDTDIDIGPPDAPVTW
jgi:phage replication-related protein YjqB (UPF0714/DUF867 family)